MRDVTSKLSKAHETCDILSSFCSQIVLVYFQPFRRNSPLKCATQPKISYFGNSRSFKVIDVNIAKKNFLAGTCYDKQHVHAYLQLFFTLDEPISVE